MLSLRPVNVATPPLNVVVPTSVSHPLPPAPHTCPLFM